MTHAELIALVADRCGTTKKLAREVLVTATRAIAAEVLVGREVQHIPGFGAFYPKTRKRRRILDVTTGKPMRLPATEALGFRASKFCKRRRR